MPLSPSWRFRKILQLRAGFVLLLDGVADVGSVEAGDECVGLGDV
jgi:hypothetical protein